MPEKVTIREDLQIIQIESYGEVSVSDLRGSLEAVARIRRQRGFSRVFVDATGEVALPSTRPMFEFGSEIATALNGVKLAIAAASKTREDLKFIATVAVNRGATVRVFDTTKDAIAWLLEEPELAEEWE